MNSHQQQQRMQQAHQQPQRTVHPIIDQNHLPQLQNPQNPKLRL